METDKTSQNFFLTCVEIALYLL